MSSIFEIMIPIIFVAGFSILKLAISSSIEQQQSYISSPYSMPAMSYYGKYFGNISQYSSSFGSPAINYMVNWGYLKQTCYNKDGTMLVALGPTASSQLASVKTVLETLGYTTQTFDSIQDMDNYVIDFKL